MWFDEVIKVLASNALQKVAISLLSVAITVSIFELTNCDLRQTCSIIGLPKKDLRTLFGNRLDSSLAGIIIPIFNLVILYNRHLLTDQ